jgi:hypothetical protein
MWKTGKSGSIESRTLAIKTPTLVEAACSDGGAAYNT